MLGLAYHITKLKRRGKLIGFILLGLVLGFFLAWYHAQGRLQEVSSLYVPQHWLYGQVEGLPIQENEKTQFDFKVLKICKDGTLNHCEDTHLKIRLYGRKGVTKPNFKDWYFIQAKLKKPHGYANPGGYDQKRSWFVKNIKAQGQVLHAKLDKKHPYFNLRAYVHSRFLETLMGVPFKGIIIALAVGDQSFITQAQWEVFRKTGTSHLMAISGLHIGLVAGFIYGLISFLWRRTPFTAYLPAQSIAAIGGLLAAFFYSDLSGWSIPTQRACVMISVMMIMLIAQRYISRSQTWFAALLLVLIKDPIAPLSPGFWLSFMAVGLLLLQSWWSPKAKGLKKWFIPQAALFVGLMPFTFFWFHQAPLWSPLSNFFAIPMMSFAVVPVVLLAAFLSWLPFLQVLLLKGSVLILKGLWIPLEWMSHWPMSEMILYASAYELILMSMAVAGLFLFKDTPSRLLCLFGFLPLWFHPNGISEGGLDLHVLDVGQGTAIVVQTQHHTLLFDFGPQYASFDAGSQIILPFLNYHHIHTIDKAVLSHSDMDHRGGLLSVLEKKKVQELITSNPSAIKPKSIPCLKGESFEWDGVRFEFLHPGHILPKKTNNQSCVLKISNESVSILLPGDIEQKIEQTLLNHPSLKADLIVVPHHGSLSSSSEAFIKAVDPKYAIVPVGYKNRYGFPKDPVVKRYENQGAQLLKTDEEGAISISISKSSIKKIRSWRKEENGIWLQNEDN